MLEVFGFIAATAGWRKLGLKDRSGVTAKGGRNESLRMAAGDESPGQ